MQTMHSQTLWRGLLHENPAFKQLLGLCPLLAVSQSLVTAFGLSLATLIVMTCSNGLISMFREYIHDKYRLPLFVVIIASLVTIMEQVMGAFAFSLHESLGIFLALITTNCVIMGRVEAFAYKNSVLLSLLDGLAQGLGFMIALISLGAVREILAYGTLFREADRLFGPSAAHWAIKISPFENGLLLFALPPGAFITFALLIALKNAWSDSC